MNVIYEILCAYVSKQGNHDPALPSAKACTLSVRRVFGMNDDRAFKVFKKVRWGNSKAVICSACGVIHEHYFIATRCQWRCKDCNHTFSVTSGTIFALHKLPLKR